MNLYSSESTHIQTIGIKEIIVDESDDVTVECSIYTSSIPVYANLVMTFEKLNHLLMMADAKGDVIIELLADKLKELSIGLNAPFPIGVENIMKDELVIPDCDFKAYAVKEKVNGKWLENVDSIYLVE